MLQTRAQNKNAISGTIMLSPWYGDLRLEILSTFTVLLCVPGCFITDTLSNTENRIFISWNDLVPSCEWEELEHHQSLSFRHDLENI